MVASEDNIILERQLIHLKSEKLLNVNLQKNIQGLLRLPYNNLIGETIDSINCK